MMNQKLNQIRGCLIGGAVGDALGSPIEFYYESQIFDKYGKPGIQDYALNPDQIAEITDDTQMTLFTAVGFNDGNITRDEAVSFVINRRNEYSLR